MTNKLQAIVYNCIDIPNLNPSDNNLLSLRAKYGLPLKGQVVANIGYFNVQKAQWDLLRESMDRAFKDLEGQTRDELQALGRRLDSAGSTGEGHDPLALASIQQAVQRILSAVEALEHRPSDGLADTGSKPTPQGPPFGPPASAPATDLPPVKDAEIKTGDKGKRVLSAIERLKQMRGG